jgi:hypothetical protein
MPEERQLAGSVATLNEAIDVINALKSGGLGALLGGLGPSRVSSCDYDCGCNQSMCGCRGSVKSSVMDTISFPEFLAIREARLAELKAAIEALSLPSALK